MNVYKGNRRDKNSTRIRRRRGADDYARRPRRTIFSLTLIVVYLHCCNTISSSYGFAFVQQQQKQRQKQQYPHSSKPRKSDGGSCSDITTILITNPSPTSSSLSSSSSDDDYDDGNNDSTHADNFSNDTVSTTKRRRRMKLSLSSPSSSLALPEDQVRPMVIHNKQTLPKSSKNKVSTNTTSTNSTTANEEEDANPSENMTTTTSSTTSSRRIPSKPSSQTTKMFQKTGNNPVLAEALLMELIERQQQQSSQEDGPTPTAGEQVTIEHFNSVLSIWIQKDQKDSMDRAEKLFHWLRNENGLPQESGGSSSPSPVSASSLLPRPDYHTYKILVDGYCSRQQPDEAENIVKCMVHDYFVDLDRRKQQQQ